MATIFMFAGQGSQHYQMGMDLYESNSLFQQNMDMLDEKIRQQIDISIIEYIYDRKKSIVDPLNDPTLSSLSLFVVELALAKTLLAKCIRPDILFGCSLGTFIAGILAECISEESAIGFFLNHEKVFGQGCEDGYMVVVLGSIEAYYNNMELREIAEIAAIYFDSNFTIATQKHSLVTVERILQSYKLNYQLIPVMRAFHSVWIEGAKKGFIELYSRANWAPPKLPIVCSSTADFVPVVNQHSLWAAVRNSIDFRSAARFLESVGPHQYIDVSPQGTLANNLSYLLRASSTSSIYRILSPFSRASKNIDLIMDEIYQAPAFY